MPLLLLSVVQVSRPALPATTSVRLGPAVTYRIRRVPTPPLPEIAEDHRSASVKVGGRIVRLGPTAEYYYIDDVKVGRDGSLLITRRTSGDFWSTNDFIRVGRREWQVRYSKFEARVSDYVDAKNYSGEYVEQKGPSQYPYSAPTAFRVQAGRSRVYGPGSPVKYLPTGDMLVEIPVDREGRPSGAEMHDHDVLRLYKPHGYVDFGDMTFAALVGGQTLVLEKGRDLFSWQGGRFLSARRIPAGWSVGGSNPNGDLILWQGGHSANHTWDEHGEDVRSLALLTGNQMSPLRFAFPKEAKQILWRDRPKFRPDGSIWFTVYVGDEVQAYDIRPR